MGIGKKEEMRIINKILICCFFLLAAGCAAAQKPQTPFIPGSAVETLSAMVTISVKTPDGGLGGNGYMVYRRPDRFHLVILTPFGTTAIEFFARDDRVTFMVPSKGVAYVGSFADLPEKGGMQGWRMMQWVVEGAPLLNPGARGDVELTGADGRKSIATYGKDGLLERKVSGDGEEVLYRDYQSVGGVPFPALIEFTDRRGVRVKITFEEPDINKPVEDTALTPNLEGITLLPLSSFKGA